jgi:hypothetical protein
MSHKAGVSFRDEQPSLTENKENASANLEQEMASIPFETTKMISHTRDDSYSTMTTGQFNSKMAQSDGLVLLRYI